MVRLILALSVALGGCATEPDRARSAERRYQIVAIDGSHAERCAAAREVARAYLDAEDGQAYRLWNSVAGTQCQLAALKS